MSFNRFTTTYWHKNYARIWHYAHFPVLIFLLLLPALFTHPLLLNEAQLVYNPISDRFVAHSQTNMSRLYAALVSWMIVTTFLNIVLNIVCWLRISKYSQASRQQSDYRLFLYSFVTVFIQLIAVSTAILNKLSTDNDPTKTWLLSRIGQTMTLFGSDLLTLSPPYILVVFSKKIRRAVKLVFVKEKPASLPPNFRATRSANSKAIGW
uniref:Serpentine receptor class gamma n=1 Tax=Caenorhabditis japonica TaxID=281687 RepID=A0A8R1HQC7_CAEJA